MTTPKREAILKRATELWRSDQVKSGCVELAELNPEYNELLESGYVAVAQSELMRDSDDYKDYLLRELGELAQPQSKEIPKLQPLDIDIIDTILREACFIGGGRGCGKSSLAMYLATLLMGVDVKVKVVDSSRVWLKKSSIPYYVQVPSPTLTKYHAVWNLPNAWNCVYDVSKLTTRELREFVSGMASIDFMDFVRLDELGYEAKACYVLEECQNLIPSGALRNNDFGEISRLVTQGRNYGLSYIAVSQRLASVDVNLVEISGLCYFGKTQGDNNLRKLKAWIGKEWLEKVRDLQVGEFLVQYGSKINLEKFPLWQSLTKPQRLTQTVPYVRK